MSLLHWWIASVDYIRVRLDLVMENEIDVLLMYIYINTELVSRTEMWVTHFIDW